MKYCHHFQLVLLSIVAPLVGAWIEITVKMNVGFEILVAPLVGAWIEIKAKLNSVYGMWSLLL